MKILSINKILHEKPTITFNKVCPVIILANNRTPKLIGLNIYETNSIGSKSSAKPNEVPISKTLFG